MQPCCKGAANRLCSSGGSAAAGLHTPLCTVPHACLALCLGQQVIVAVLKLRGQATDT